MAKSQTIRVSLTLAEAAAVTKLGLAHPATGGADGVSAARKCEAAYNRAVRKQWSYPHERWGGSDNG